MHVRKARIEDADEACLVLRRSITELCVEDHRNDEGVLARWLSNKTPENFAGWIEGSHLYVAESEGRIRGVAGLTDTGSVTLNYVAPEARFKGVSKALLQALEEKAAQLGCEACTLESTKTAERFYRDAGYREKDGPSSVMFKVLAEQKKG